MGLGKGLAQKDRNFDYLKDTVQRIWKVIRGPGEFLLEEFPVLGNADYPRSPTS